MPTTARPEIHQKWRLNSKCVWRALTFSICMHARTHARTQLHTDIPFCRALAYDHHHYLDSSMLKRIPLPSALLPSHPLSSPPPQPLRPRLFASAFCYTLQFSLLPPHPPLLHCRSLVPLLLAMLLPLVHLVCHADTCPHLVPCNFAWDLN